MEDATVAKIKENLAKARAKLAKYDATVAENVELRKDVAIAAQAISMLEKQLAEKPVQHINNFTLQSIQEFQQMIEGLSSLQDLLRDEITALRKTVTSASENSTRSFADQLITTEENLSKGVGEVNKTLQSVDNGVKEVNSFWKKFKINIPAFPEINLKPLEKFVSNISEKITNFKINWPSKAEDAIPVRLSDGEDFYKLQAQFFGTGGGGSVPKITLDGGIQAVPVVNPDGTNIGGGSGSTSDVNIIEVGGSSITLGQKTMANSFPVTLASNQSDISVVGNIASGSADSGNPVKIGGVYNSTIPTFTNGQRGDLQLGSRGSAHVTLYAANTNQPIFALNDTGDGVTADATLNKLMVVSRNTVFNGTTWDRLRGDSTDGLLVNLGTNNDVTVTGTVTANAGTNLNTSALLTTTDFTTVFGTSSLVLGTQADDVANTSDGFQTTSFGYMFDGTTWDRVRGNSTDGLLVNLGSNNDITVTGTVAVTQSGTWDEVGINDSGNSITVDGTVAVSSITTSVTPGTAAANLGKAEDAAHSTGDTGVFMLGVRNESQTGRTDADGDYASISVDSAQNVMIVGATAHDTTDTKNPVKIGLRTKDLKATPAAVGADDVTNAHATRSGIQYVVSGHPNVLTQSLQVTDADGAQTDTAIITASAGTSIVVTKVSVTADNANTGDVSVRIGFGTANTPAADAAQMLLFHPGVAAGSGVIEGSGSGIIGIGASNEDVRITCEDPAGGSINVIVTYWTESI